MVRFSDRPTRQQPATTPYEDRRSSESKIPVPSRIGQDDVTCEQQESSTHRNDSCVAPESAEDTHPCQDDTQISQEDPHSGNETASEDVDLRRSSRLKKPAHALRSHEWNLQTCTIVNLSRACGGI